MLRHRRDAPRRSPDRLEDSDNDEDDGWGPGSDDEESTKKKKKPVRYGPPGDTIDETIVALQAARRGAKRQKGALSATGQVRVAELVKLFSVEEEQV